MSPVDLIIVEGFKAAPHRKIEVHRIANGKDFLFPRDPAIAGIVTDAAVDAVDTALPIAHLDDIASVVALIETTAIPAGDIIAGRFA